MDARDETLAASTGCSEPRGRLDSQGLFSTGFSRGALQRKFSVSPVPCGFPRGGFAGRIHCFPLAGHRCNGPFACRLSAGRKSCPLRGPCSTFRAALRFLPCGGSPPAFGVIFKERRPLSQGLRPFRFPLAAFWQARRLFAVPFARPFGKRDRGGRSARAFAPRGLGEARLAPRFA